MSEIISIIESNRLVADLIVVVNLIAMWVVFTKAGRKGWESIIPFYNTYVEFELVYGNGWKFLLLLIPLYNIYVIIKLEIDLAHKFNQSTAFGWGLVLVPTVFLCILAFGSAEYMDGSYAQNDTVSNFASNVRDSVNNTASNKDDNKTFEAIEKLKELHDSGAITDEEFEAKKEELLKKI